MAGLGIVPERGRLYFVCVSVVVWWRGVLCVRVYFVVFSRLQFFDFEAALGEGTSSFFMDFFRIIFSEKTYSNIRAPNEAPNKCSDEVCRPALGIRVVARFLFSRKKRRILHFHYRAALFHTLAPVW